MMVWTGRVFIFLSLQVVLCCSAYDLKCTVHQNGDLTNYNIIDSSGVSLKHCSYQWRNGTNHVLANQMGQMKELVVNKSINHLVTSKCSNISFTRDCTSEDEVHTATCYIMCHEIAHNKGDGKASSDNQTGPIIGLVVGLLVVGVLGFVGYKYKHKICSCGQCRCRYPADGAQKNPTDGPSAYPLV